MSTPSSISFLFKLAEDIDWHFVASPTYDNAESVLNWLNIFMMGRKPVTITDMRMW